MQGHSILLDATFASAGASYVQLSTQLAGPSQVGGGGVGGFVSRAAAVLWVPKDCRRYLYWS